MHYYTVYFNALSSLTELFRALEIALYYKFYVLKKGAKSKIDAQVFKLSNDEFEYIYKTYKLILKNVLHFIWSFEYNIFKDINKLTKLYVIDDNDLDLGYHIYPKNKNEYKVSDTFLKFINNAIYDLFIEKIDIEHDKYDAVYESIQVLFNLDEYMPNCIYISNKDNEVLKNLDI